MEFQRSLLNKLNEILTTGFLPGAMAGLVGGLVFGVTMSELDQLPTFAEIVRADSSLIGFIVVLAVAVIIGAAFGLLIWYQRPGVGETLIWGLVYGTFWWYLGPLTLLSLMLGDGLTWDLHSAQAEFSILPGLVLYGASTGLALVFIQWRLRSWTGTVSAGSLLRGALAGLISAALLGIALDAQDQLLASLDPMTGNSHVGAWLVTLLIGLLAGVGFALIYPRPADGAGAGLIRGSVYGFFWWVVGVLTLVPLIGGVSITWSLEEVRDKFATLPGYLLFGAGVALLYQWLTSLVHLLFSDFVPGGDQEGVGVQGLRIVGRSALAGLVGGLIFSIVMLQIGFFPSVADLVGTDSEVAGFFVHLAIAETIGLSYGVLFRRQSYDVGSALGWGVSYGFVWSMLGPLTLMPVFLGSTPQWTIEAATTAFPNLIGHLGYGAALGITFYLLEARYRPWWIPHNQMALAKVTRRKEQVLTSAPALWTVLMLIGLTLPVLIGM